MSQKASINGASGTTIYDRIELKRSQFQNACGLPDRSRDADGSTPVHDDSYDYDQNGNVLAISDAVAGYRGDRDMLYDDLNRLVEATSPMFGTASYSYDVLDNLTQVHVTGGSQPRNHAYCYDGIWRLTNVAATTCSGGSVIGLGYDVQGNLANKSGVTYGFDYGNRMRSGGPETYRYDAHGRRVRSNSSAGLVHSFYSQSGQILFQRDERSSKRRQYIYLGGSLLAEHSRPLSGSTVTVTYQHTDALGSPVATTNSAKTVLQRSEYEPYGYLLNRPMEDGPGYTGHVTDAATGLVYMQQRYYDPLIPRFLSVDPVTAYSDPVGQFHRYRYANNNPYRFTDPDGRPPKWLNKMLGLGAEEVGAKHQVNSYAAEMIDAEYKSIAAPFEQSAEAVGKAHNAVDSRVKVSVEGTLAKGGAIKGSVDITRGEASVGIAPIAGEGARLAITVSPRNPIQIPLVANAAEAKAGISMPLFEAHFVPGIGGGVDVSLNGGYLEITPSVEFGYGSELIRYPGVDFQVTE